MKTVSKAKKEIAERSVDYSLQIVELFRKLKKDELGRILGRQLLRSGTSIGANVHEAQGGQSRADFISKISIAYKEAKETLYWLRVIQRAKVIEVGEMVDVFDETQQLIRILSSILLTAKNGRKSSSNSSLLTLNS